MASQGAEDHERLEVVAGVCGSSSIIRTRRTKRHMARQGHLPLVTLIVVAAVAVASTRAQAPPRLEPVDQGPQKPDFMAFRTELRQTIERRDGPALLRVVHPNIKNTFGGDDGIDAFERLWRLERADSEVWRELGAVLALGGTFLDPDQFAAPYVTRNGRRPRTRSMTSRSSAQTSACVELRARAAASWRR